MPDVKEPIDAKELKNKKTDKKEAFNNKVVRVFDDVLDKDEKIVKSYSPKKSTMYLANIVKPLCVYLVIIAFFMFLYFSPSELLNEKDCLVCVLVMSAFIAIIEVIMILVTKKYLKNTCYIITNKRVIMSYGFFDVDYRFIELEHVKDIEFKWNIFDKVNGKKSGQILFYPDEKHANFVLFYNIDNALESYLEIEELIGVGNGSNSKQN